MTLAASRPAWHVFLMRPHLESHVIENLRHVLDSGFLAEGAVTSQFEREFADYVGATNAIATTSCTTALELALRCSELPGRTRVLVPDFTHPGTALAVMNAGFRPVLVDVGVEERNVTAGTLDHKLPPETTGFVPVSLFGNPLDPDVYGIARESGLLAIEDAACSIGAMVSSQKVGSIGNLACFSLHPRKIVTAGEGGIITTDDAAWATRIRHAKNFGYDGTQFTGWGTNCKFSDLQAALALTQFRNIEAIVKDRTEKAHIYNDLLERVDAVRLPVAKPGRRHTFQAYTLLLSSRSIRDKIGAELAGRGIESQIGTYALHAQPYYAGLERLSDLSNSQLLYERLLTLPLHRDLKPKDQEQIATIVTRAASG